MLQHPTIHEELMRLRYQDLLEEARRDQLAAQAAPSREGGRPLRTLGGNALHAVAAFTARRRRRMLRRLAAS